MRSTVRLLRVVLAIPVFAVLIFVLGSLAPVTDALARTLSVADNPQLADVVVAVSAGKLSDCTAHPNLFTRERQAAEAMKAGLSRSGRMIISGVYSDPAVMSPEACHQKLAAMLDIPPPRLIVENRADNTYENAVNTVAIMQAHSWRDAVLVTSKTHMPRAVRSFEKQGVSVYPVQVVDQPSHFDGFLNPMRWRLMRRFLYEYVALVKYGWYGYI